MPDTLSPPLSPRGERACHACPPHQIWATTPGECSPCVPRTRRRLSPAPSTRNPPRPPNRCGGAAGPRATPLSSSPLWECWDSSTPNFSARARTPAPRRLVQTHTTSATSAPLPSAKCERRASALEPAPEAKTAMRAFSCGASTILRTRSLRGPPGCARTFRPPLPFLSNVPPAPWLQERRRGSTS